MLGRGMILVRVRCLALPVKQRGCIAALHSLCYPFGKIADPRRCLLVMAVECFAQVMRQVAGADIRIFSLRSGARACPIL